MHAGERHSFSERYTPEDLKMIADSPSKRPKLAVLKIRGGQAADLVVCCHCVLGLITHWIDGRSYACPGEDCPACIQCWPDRWAGFLVVRCVGTKARAPMLLELSSSSWDRLAGLMKLEGYGSVQALFLHAERRKKKSPLIVDPVAEAPEAAGRMVESMAVWSAISPLYGLPQPRLDETDSMWVERCKPAARRLIELAIVRASR